jgi:aspartyl-tRNA(Asn)/glutamyl-tRNA(Gln) amidotransferase subunit B
MPLLEIVTEPDIHSPDEAYEYLTRLKAILKYLDVSDCDMEKGSLRCDANISVRPRGATLLGTKVELKNMNSFKHVRAGLEYEASRQIEAVKAGERIFQETRLWDPEKGITVLMRSKEEAHDYRYFPEPDLVPFAEDVAITLPELPAARADRFREKMALSDYDAGVLTSEKETADYFEECLALYKNPKTIANWITGEMMARANEKGLGIRGLNISPAGLAELLTMIDEGLISGKIAKEIVTEMIAGGGAPREIVAKKGLAQISDTEEIEKVARMVIEQNPKSVSDYKGGKKNALGFLVGQVMKETKGKANPALVNETLARLIG